MSKFINKLSRCFFQCPSSIIRLMRRDVHTDEKCLFYFRSIYGLCTKGA